jgi:DNA-binding NarL/FixJ family response regulator
VSDGVPRRGRDITVALCIADPVLAERVCDVLDRPGQRLLWPKPDEDVEADVAIADQLAAVPGVPTVALSSDARTLAAWRSGARAVLPPGGGGDELCAVVQAVARGFAVVPPSLLEPLLTDFGPPWRRPDRLGQDPSALLALTPREQEVLRLMTEGASNKMIARSLGIAFSTAKFHVASLIEKLGARSRTDAVAEAARRGLVML